MPHIATQVAGVPLRDDPCGGGCRVSADAVRTDAAPEDGLACLRMPVSGVARTPVRGRPTFRGCEAQMPVAVVRRGGSGSPGLAIRCGTVVLANLNDVFRQMRSDLVGERAEGLQRGCGRDQRGRTSDDRSVTETAGRDQERAARFGAVLTPRVAPERTTRRTQGLVFGPRSRFVMGGLRRQQSENEEGTAEGGGAHGHR